jgi:Protein of unknown function (DUF3224)
MANELTASVEITSRDETVYDEPSAGPKLSRVVINRAFTGDLEGTSVANLVLCQGEGGGGYMSSERFTGSIGGKKGTVVFHHGRVNGGASPVAFGEIIPNSGTGELEGIAGHVNFAFSPAGASVTLSLTN